MTHISFYVLSSGESGQQSACLQFTCRLVEKVTHAGKSVFLHTCDNGQSEQMDRLLWTFRQGSFVPHEIWQGQQQDGGTCPVLIGTDEPPEDHHEVLINLADDVPSFFSRYERMLEIVDPQNPDPGRQRYRYYKDRGYPLDLHKIGHKINAR